MTVKERVMSLLEQNRGRFISGEAIAAELGVTRTAVWKAVKAIEGGGCPIEAVTNRGYRLKTDADILTAEAVKAGLKPETACRVEVLGSVTSTNELARQRAADGEKEGVVIISGSQTMGRGRMGRSFYSPSDTGLYMSILLRPKFSAEASTFLTTAAAVAAAQAVEEVSGRSTDIKWVNDLWMDGKKVCGILTEGVFSMESGGLDYAVVGMGVNVYPPEGGFPEDISHLAGAVFPEGKQTAHGRSRIAAGIIDRFWDYYTDLESRSFYSEYRRRCFVIGKPITVIRGQSRKTATALDIDDQCRLIVRFDDGVTEALSSGEISIRPI